MQQRALHRNDNYHFGMRLFYFLQAKEESRVSAKSGSSGKNQGNAFCIEISGKRQGIRLILEAIREIACLHRFNK